MIPARILLPLGGLLSVLAIPSAFAAKLLDGSFLAVKDCPAYVSKAERTNPDATRLVPGRVYPVFEVNVPEAPEAYRIRIEGADPKERWVGADCGEYPPKSSPADIAARVPKTETASAAPPAEVAAEAKCPTPPPGADACRTCGPADSWVLALNWQPGLCQAGQKPLANHPECRDTDPNLYQARNFTLRELRPLRKSCPKGVGFCGGVEREPQQLTDYPPLALADTTRQSLARFMPGTAGDSGLERQAWHRHGSCTGFPEEAYFKRAVELVQQFNQSGMGAFMAENLGKIVRREEFFKQIEASLGEGARKHLNIECGGDGKLLTGVVINLASGVAPSADLKALIQQAPRAGAAGNCASRFGVDEIGFAAEPPKEPRPKRRPPPKPVPSAEPASPSAPELF